MKLYEFTAMARCDLVVAAESEEEARKEVDSLERAWFETGDFMDISDVELIDVREPKSDDLKDEAHIVVNKKKGEL